MYCFYEQTNVHKRWFYYLYLNRFSDSHSVIEYRVTFSVSTVIFQTNNSSLQGSLLWLLSNFSWEWEKSKNNVTNWPMAIADVKCHCIDFIRSHNSIKKNSIDMATTTWYLRAMTSKYITSSWRNKMLRFTKSSYSHNSTIC